MGNGSTPFSFLSGFVQSRDIGRVIAQIDEGREYGSTDSYLLKWIRAERKWFYFTLDWTATKITVVKTELFATGPSGEVYIGTLENNREEIIDDSNQGPRGRGPIRDLRLVGGYLYACGMSRQVYRREAPGTWVRRDEGVVLPLGSTSIAGFNSIDGISDDEIYAVGFGGQIWRFQNGRWLELSSPTNVVLHQVRVVNQSLIYVCGQKGILLRGTGEQWQEIRHGATANDIWGIEWFNGKLFVATETQLFVLTQEDILEEVNTQLGHRCSFRHLHANDGVMWSFGPKHVLWTDGSSWYDVTPNAR